MPITRECPVDSERGRWDAANPDHVMTKLDASTRMHGNSNRVRGEEKHDMNHHNLRSGSVGSSIGHIHDTSCLVLGMCILVGSCHALSEKAST